MAEIISVSALNGYTRSLLEKNEVLNSIAVCGEIAGFVHHKSGHLYFSLRDENASIKAVMFRSNARDLSFEPQDGMNVILWGYVTLYEKTGSYQFIAESMRPNGLGAVQMAFEKLKQKLYQEGLFDPERKKPIPEFPKTIGLVTSRDGAALQDVLSITQRRWPMMHFCLVPVNVQGMDAPRQIEKAIKQLDQTPDIDVILVTRGGGSAEDLWIFNDEALARAAAACSKPLVSAVGHEIDFTILDFVADLRAPTPSAAAELLCPDGEKLQKKNEYFLQNIHRNIQSRWLECYNGYGNCCKAIFNGANNKLNNGIVLLNAVDQQIIRGITTACSQKENALFQLVNTINSASPDKIFSRGFAAVCSEDHQPLSLSQLKVGQHVQVYNRQVSATCCVEAVETSI